MKLMKIDARVSEVLVRPSLAASPIPNRHRGRDAGTPRDAPRSTRDSNPLPCPDAARVVEAARDARRHGMMTAATTLSRASSVVGVGAGATSRRPVDRAVSAVATSSSYSRRARRVATVRAASSRTSSSATTTTTTTTRSALAMETPSTTTTDADDDDDKTGVVPSLRELRAAIPAECFVPCLRESMKYAAIDLGLLAACFGLWSPLVVDNPWMLPLYAPVTGTIMWMCFVVGHDCGHGSFRCVSSTNVFHP